MPLLHRCKPGHIMVKMRYVEPPTRQTTKQKYCEHFAQLHKEHEKHYFITQFQTAERQRAATSKGK